MAIIIGEGYEGAGYENVGLWTENVSAGCTCDEDSAIPGSPPAGLGSQCLRIAIDTDTDNSVSLYDRAADTPTNYVRFYFYADTTAILDTSVNYLCILVTTTLYVASCITMYRSGASYYFRYYGYTGGVLTVLDTSAAISLDTWYRIEFKYDITNLAWEWKINGVSEGSGALVATTRTPQQLWIGVYTGFAGDDYYYDGVMWRDDTWPGSADEEYIPIQVIG